MAKYLAASVLLLIFAASQSYAMPIHNHAALFSTSPHQQYAYLLDEPMSDLTLYDRLPVTTNEVAGLNTIGKLSFSDFIDKLPTHAASADFHPGTHQAHPVPEPSTLMLLGVGCIVVSVLVKKQSA